MNQWTRKMNHKLLLFICSWFHCVRKRYCSTREGWHMRYKILRMIILNLTALLKSICSSYLRQTSSSFADLSLVLWSILMVRMNKMKSKINAKEIEGAKDRRRSERKKEQSSPLRELLCKWAGPLGLWKHCSKPDKVQVHFTTLVVVVVTRLNTKIPHSITQTHYFPETLMINHLLEALVAIKLSGQCIYRVDFFERQFLGKK